MSKTAKIHRFVRFVMYCIITTCSVECYCACYWATTVPVAVGVTPAAAAASVA